MNMIHHELRSYRKQTLYWSIGIILLLLVSFYKVSGMSQAPGGVQSMLDALPSFLQAFFGMGRIDYTTGIGIYSMIHMYVSIALAFHAGTLGAHIFAKEELDHTCEFLYVKGKKRLYIFQNKYCAGILLLLVLNLVCLSSVYLLTFLMHIPMELVELLPYIFLLFLQQLFFFTLALCMSVMLTRTQRAGMFSTSIILIMFLITMYTKMGGNVGILERLSIFSYSDASYIQNYGYGGVHSLVLVLLIICMYVVATVVHEHRDVT